MKLTTLGKGQCDLLRREIEMALEDFRKKFGLKIEVTNMTYGGHEMSAKVEMKIDSPQADAQFDAILTRLNCPRGSRSRIGKKTFICTGYDPYKPKNNIIMTDTATGKTGYTCNNTVFAEGRIA